MVFLREDGSLLVGDAAGRRGISEPSRVAREFKRRFGDTTPILLGGISLTADALWAKLLAWVITTVTSAQGGPPEAVAITHPANWGPYKLELLASAIRSAEVPNPTTLSEPEAAAISYADSNKVEPGETVAVYDLGGGTFDAAVLRRTEVGFELVGRPEGIERLGGIDVDEAVFAHVASVLGTAIDDLDPDDPAALSAVARLRQECVAAKEALSQDTDVTIPVTLPTLSTEVRLTRAELEAMIRPTLTPTVQALRRAVASADLKPEDLKAVLLVGGSSRIPLVGQLVSTALGRPVFTDAHPKYSVATGAALYAEGAEDKKKVMPVEARQAAPAIAAAAVAAETAEETKPDVPATDDAQKEEAEAPPAGEDSSESESESVSAAGPPPISSKKKGRRAAAATVAAAAAAAASTQELAPSPEEPAEGGPEPPPVRTKSSRGNFDVIRERIKSRKMILIPILLLIAILAGAQVFLGPKAEGTQNEIFLAPKEVPGVNTFTPVASELPSGPVAPETQPPGEVTGTDAGLYAAVRGSSSCRTEALVSFLEAPENAGRRQVWASAAGVAAADVRPYIATLTPAWTRFDARVTEFGLKNGKAAPRQIVLEAGSAVLLDRTGFPRVRCASGSPLDRARSLPQPPVYRGTPWNGFNKSTLVVIKPGPQTRVITLFDPVTRLLFDRLPGSIVIIDIDRTTPDTPLIVVEPGQPSTITGALWPPGTAVTIRFDNPADSLGIATADGAGNFAQPVTIPESSRPGIHQVTMEGGGFTVTQAVYVIPRGVRVVTPTVRADRSDDIPDRQTQSAPTGEADKTTKPPADPLLVPNFPQ